MRNLLLICSVLFAFIACEGPMGPQGPAGPEGEGEWYIYDQRDLIVTPGMWERETDSDGTNVRYVCDFGIDNLDKDMFDNGLVATYMFVNPNNVDDGYFELNYSFPVEVRNEGYVWTEHYNAVIYPGGVTFILQISDFPGPNNIVLPTQRFRVLLHY